MCQRPESKPRPHRAYVAGDCGSDGGSRIKVFLGKHGEGIDDILGCIAAELVHQSFSKVISHRHQRWRGPILLVACLHACRAEWDLSGSLAR